MLTIAHVSDIHIGGPPRASERTALVLDHLLALSPRPDVLLVTGDVADHGRPEEYVVARALLDRWPGPMVVGTGNHDVREAFAAGLLDEPTGQRKRLDQELLLPGVRLLVLDSLVAAPSGERIDHGELATSSLAWLDERLGLDDRPAFVGLHHPPVAIGVSLMDPIRLLDPAPLAATLGRHPHVVATLVGHAHTQCATTFAGRPLLVGGGVASTVPLDAEPLPRVWEDGPPTIAVHLLDDEGRLTTHWRAVIAS